MCSCLHSRVTSELIRKKADVAVKDEFSRRKQVSKIILVPQSDFILELPLSVEILFKWYLCVQLDMKEEVSLQVPVCLLYSDKQLLHHS